MLLSTLLNDETVDQYYEQSFKQLIHLQSINGAEHFPAYSYEKLLSEMHLLTDWMLPSLDIHPTAEQKLLMMHLISWLSSINSTASYCTS